MLIRAKPIPQTGENCKIIAIGTIEKYFSELYGYMTIPVHKNKLPLISIREISKRVGSQQGELLEIRQIKEILEFLGYSAAIQKCIDIADFRKMIISKCMSGLPLITVFAVDVHTGLPTDQYSGKNEHAAVIVGYQRESDLVSLLHWGKKYICTLSQLFNSIMCLPEERNQEIYRSIKHTDIIQKYKLVDEKNQYPMVKKSIVPQKNSGFRGKLICIDEMPEFKFMRNQRKNLLIKKTKSMLESKIMTTLSVNDNYTALVHAAKNENSKSIKLLLSTKESDISIISTKYDTTPLTLYSISEYDTSGLLLFSSEVATKELIRKELATPVMRK